VDRTALRSLGLVASADLDDFAEAPIKRCQMLPEFFRK
jgi:hypothetical protein